MRLFMIGSVLTREQQRPAPSGRVVVVTSLALALTGGLIELAVLWLRKTDRPMLRLSTDYPWSVPLAVVAAVLLSVMLLLGLSSIVARRRLRMMSIASAAALAAFDVLLLVPRLAPYAAALLALGIAAQISRWLIKDMDRLTRLCGRALVIICILTGATAGLIAWRARPMAGTPAIGAPALAGPNVLVITLDTVRAASLSLYGYGRNTTPNLTRYASQGVVFERAFSAAPWTLPSHASLFTGRWPHEMPAGYETPLDARDPTLAEHFASRGYRTAGFVANMGYCSRDTGLARGFQHYEDYPRTLGQFASNSTLLRTIADNFKLRRLIENDEHLNRVSAADLNQAFLGWLSANGNAPFFAFLNYFDAHEPYLPPPPFDRLFGRPRSHGRYSQLHHAQWDPDARSVELDPDTLTEERDAYDNSLAYLDAELGKLFDELSVRHVLDNTLVVITADHGEEFAEHRVLEHGYSLYRPSVHVPLVMLWPGTLPSNRRVAEPVSTRDVAATVIDVTRTSGHSEIPGTSMATLWTGDGSGTRYASPILSQLLPPSGRMPDWYPIRKGPMASVIYGGFRFIQNGDRTEELYDLDQDPWELHDVSADPRNAAALAAARTQLLTALAGRDQRRQ
jgi:arylsulfatase A-like enzyme